MPQRSVDKYHNGSLFDMFDDNVPQDDKSMTEYIALWIINDLLDNSQVEFFNTDIYEFDNKSKAKHANI